MNQRDLSEKLEELALLLEADHGIEGTIKTVVTELRKLSNENYAPGNGLSWGDVKPKPVKKQGGFTSKSGKTMPF